MRAVGADGGYGDGCSALGGASSSKTVGSKRTRAAPQATEGLDDKKTSMDREFSEPQNIFETDGED